MWGPWSSRATAGAYLNRNGARFRAEGTTTPAPDPSPTERRGGDPPSAPGIGREGDYSVWAKGPGLGATQLRPGCLLVACAGAALAEGWGFESSRARHVLDRSRGFPRAGFTRGPRVRRW